MELILFVTFHDFILVRQKQKKKKKGRAKRKEDVKSKKQIISSRLRYLHVCGQDCKIASFASYNRVPVYASGINFIFINKQK